MYMNEEQIGKHKGAVETLMHEKKELSRLLQIVNGQLQRHMQALEEAGIDTDRMLEDMQKEQQEKAQKQQKQQQQRQESEERKRKQGSREQSRSSGSRQQSNDEKEMDEFFEDDDDERDFNPL